MNCKECGTDHSLSESTNQHQPVRTVSNHNLQPKRSSPYIHPWHSSKRVVYHTIQTNAETKDRNSGKLLGYLNLCGPQNHGILCVKHITYKDSKKVITNLGLRTGKTPKFLFVLGPEMCSTGPVGDNATEAGMLTLALELDIYSLAHHLCKMWIFYEPRRVKWGNTWHFVEE